MFAARRLMQNAARTAVVRSSRAGSANVRRVVSASNASAAASSGASSAAKTATKAALKATRITASTPTAAAGAGAGSSVNAAGVRHYSTPSWMDVLHRMIATPPQSQAQTPAAQTAVSTASTTATTPAVTPTPVQAQTQAPPTAAAGAGSGAAAAARTGNWWQDNPDAESGWTAQHAGGLTSRPIQAAVLHRSDDEAPSVKFAQGEAPRGTNFNVADHVFERSSDRGTGDDAFRGNAIYAHRQSDGGGAEGPLHHGGRYMHVLHGAYATSAERQTEHGVNIAEHEELTHAVAPHRFVASLDKETGEVHVNPNQTEEQAAAHRDRLGRLYQVAQRFRPSS